MSRRGTVAGGRGQALVEFALIAPVLLVLVMGLLDFGQAYQVRITITNAAREGARLAARGNIFSDAQILQVVRDQSRGVDIAAHGTVLLTTARSDPSSGISFTTDRLIGAAGSRLDAAKLTELEQSLTASEPDYLRNEEFVVLEIVYDHPLTTGFFGTHLPMYAYTVMQVSAPS